MRVWALLVAALLAACAQQAPPGTAAQRFAAVRNSPVQLREFLYRMPKGGDLHTHLSGAAYAEGFILSGAAKGICVERATLRAVAKCSADTRPIGDALKDATFHRALVDTWSMRSFVPSSGMSGHDHFFATFRLFGEATDAAAMAREVVNRAGRQHMRYIELMITFQSGAVTTLARTLPWTGDFAAFRDALMNAGLPSLIARARADVAALDRATLTLMRCDTPEAEPGCGVTVRWLQQVTRTNPPPLVFAQSLFGMMLSRVEPRVVGIDFVAPEDDRVALADYTLQMRMLDWLHGAMPDAKVSLHAGELTLGLVPPQDLTFHIREAVELGHARRIGHGVDLSYETDASGLLHEMAARRVAVEVNLTSNDMILGVHGAQHPFPLYRAAGVPTLLSTDDEGVERIDRTHELQRAVTEFDLGWPELVALERNTLEYAFVAGASLWADARTWQKVPQCAAAEPSASCAAFLDANEKARLQWSLERDLQAFEDDAPFAAVGTAQRSGM